MTDDLGHGARSTFILQGSDRERVKKEELSCWKVLGLLGEGEREGVKPVKPKPAT